MNEKLRISFGERRTPSVSGRHDIGRHLTLSGRHLF